MGSGGTLLRVRVCARVLIRFGANPFVLVLSVKLHLPRGKLHRPLLDPELLGALRLQILPNIKCDITTHQEPNSSSVVVASRADPPPSG